ncbi:DUF1131 family protein [uncultured Cohaesibacter sp.]|uniref:DUF1131 family protein n=1 Tax=uncultured Cohaesibacter sp. TaxID=1002546 RepID=UPI00292D81A3|nr:DUF1131 family protein [uncultured Cohaesibacter sp.]
MQAKLPLLVQHVVAGILLSSMLAGCSMSLGPIADSTGAPPPQATLSMTDAGVNGLTPETGYGPKAIAAAMPGYSIETIEAAGESGTQWTYAAFQNGLQMVQIFKGSGGKIGVVHGVGEAIAGPNGERLGMTFAQSRLPRSACRVGKSLWRGMAICKAANTNKITLVFAISEYRGPFNSLPPSSQLQKATLQRILWTP